MKAIASIVVRSKSWEQQLGPLDPLRADLYHNLGGINHARGRYAKGELYARRAVKIRERAFSPDWYEEAGGGVPRRVLWGRHQVLTSFGLLRH